MINLSMKLMLLITTAFAANNYKLAQLSCQIPNGKWLKQVLNVDVEQCFQSCSKDPRCKVFVHSKVNRNCHQYSEDGACQPNRMQDKYVILSNCNEKLTGNKGVGYRGCQTQTRKGKTCQAWNTQTPHQHITPLSSALGTDGTNNYCRNPDGQPTIWCYTTDPATRTQPCNPLGPIDTSQQNWKPFKIGAWCNDYSNGKRMTRLSGYTFQTCGQKCKETNKCIGFMFDSNCDLFSNLDCKWTTTGWKANYYKLTTSQTNIIGKSSSSSSSSDSCPTGKTCVKSGLSIYIKHPGQDIYGYDVEPCKTSINTLTDCLSLCESNSSKGCISAVYLFTQKACCSKTKTVATGGKWSGGSSNRFTDRDFYEKITPLKTETSLKGTHSTAVSVVGNKPALQGSPPNVNKQNDQPKKDVFVYNIETDDFNNTLQRLEEFDFCLQNRKDTYVGNKRYTLKQCLQNCFENDDCEYLEYMNTKACKIIEEECVQQRPDISQNIKRKSIVFKRKYQEALEDTINQNTGLIGGIATAAISVMGCLGALYKWYKDCRGGRPAEQNDDDKAAADKAEADKAAADKSIQLSIVAAATSIAAKKADRRDIYKVKTHDQTQSLSDPDKPVNGETERDAEDKTKVNMVYNTKGAKNKIDIHLRNSLKIQVNQQKQKMRNQ